jgi:uncharacterized surface protein with fasciclin (FAS1) repeats
MTSRRLCREITVVQDTQRNRFCSHRYQLDVEYEQNGGRILESEPQMSHVFISYSTQNSDYAMALAEKLRVEGFDVWIDHNRLVSSDDWWRSIVMALRSCSAVLVILTPQADQSRWVQREITLAEKYGKPLFPLWLDGSLDTPNWELFVRTQYEDVRGRLMPDSMFYERLAQYATRKATRGENVTALVDRERVADVDTELRAEIANPPSPIENDAPVSRPRTVPAPTRSPRRLLAAGLLIAVIAVIGALLLLSLPESPLGILNPVEEPGVEINQRTVAQTLTDYEDEAGFFVEILLESEHRTVLDDPQHMVTVFVPTNDAIDSALAADGRSPDSITDEELAEFVIYHLIDSAVFPDTITDHLWVRSIAGQDFTLTRDSDGTLYVGDPITVLEADASSENGVIYLIDGVITPDLDNQWTIGEELYDYQEAGNYEINTFIDMAEVDGDVFMSLFADPSMLLTIFVPTDDAFDVFAEEWGTSIDEMLSDEGPISLYDLMNYHIAPGYAYVLDQGETILSTKDGGPLFIDNNGRVGADEGERYRILETLHTDTGVIHFIEGVLIPPSYLDDDNGEDG